VQDQELSEQQIRTTAEQHVFRNIRNPFRTMLLRVVLRYARHAIAHRENMRFARTRTFALMRRLFRRLGDLFAASGLIGNRDDIFYLTVAESLDVVRGTSTSNDLQQLVRMRKMEYETFAQRTPGERFLTTGIPGLHRSSADETTRPTGNRLIGTPCSSGRVEGEAMVVLDPTTVNGNAGKILVARSTDPGWVFLMIVSKGIIVEKGSVLSHTAIIGRELGIPTVVGVKHATSVIPNKAHIDLDGERGVITWH
jgi:phosphohistidine swiveling domain-containing protein